MDQRQHRPVFGFATCERYTESCIAIVRLAKFKIRATVSFHDYRRCEENAIVASINPLPQLSISAYFTATDSSTYRLH